MALSIKVLFRLRKNHAFSEFQIPAEQNDVTVMCYKLFPYFSRGLLWVCRKTL